jgi:hypothetical protein
VADQRRGMSRRGSLDDVVSPKRRVEDVVPLDHEFVCLTFGPTAFGGREGNPPRELAGCGATVHFGPPVAVGEHWRPDLGNFTIAKLENTRLAIVASDLPQVEASSDKISEFRQTLEDHAYNALRGILIQGSPFELQIAGLEIRGTYDAGRMRESASFMRPRTAHPWEKILRIDDSILDTTARVTSTLNAILIKTDSFDRLRRGLDHWDRATMEHRLDLRLHALVAALEALIVPEKGRTQGQFIDRCKVFVTISQADRVLNEIYELRSQVEHSNDWRSALEEIRPPLTDKQAEAVAFLRCYQAELIVRAAYLRILLDADLLKRFASVEAIREFWHDIKGRTLLWGAPMNLPTQEDRHINIREKESFDTAKAIEARA